MYTADERFSIQDYPIVVPHSIYTIEILSGDDPSEFIRGWVGCINSSDVDDLGGNLITFSGAAKTLHLEDATVLPEYRHDLTPDPDNPGKLLNPNGFILYYRLTLVFRWRRIPWDQIWRNPEAFLDYHGKPYVYGQSKPFQQTATQPIFSPVYQPAKKDDGGNYVLDCSKLGWQEVIDPSAATPPLCSRTYPGGYPTADFNGLIAALT
jgi:hypothetical protein